MNKATIQRFVVVVESGLSTPDVHGPYTLNAATKLAARLTESNRGKLQFSNAWGQKSDETIRVSIQAIPVAS